jgi:hypothetical protein
VLSTAAQALRRTTTSDAHPLVRIAASLTYADVVAGRPLESLTGLPSRRSPTTSRVQPQRGTPQPT